ICHRQRWNRADHFDIIAAYLNLDPLGVHPMVRMKVKVVGLDQHSMVPVVVITDHDEKGFIPILIGPVEAGAISTGLEGKKYERPMTHDLITDMIDKLGAKVERIVIHDLKNETYYARIELSTEDGEVDVDARPSD